MKKEYEKLVKYSKKLYTIFSIEALLGWDQETYMPKDGISRRSEQLAFLSSLFHTYQTKKEFETTLKKLIDLKTGKIKAKNFSKEQQVNLKEWRRNYLQAIKLPKSFVKEFSKTTSEATHAWIKARKDNNFALFEPHLEKIVKLCRKKATYLGYKDHPYNALLDLYEPDMTTKKTR